MDPIKDAEDVLNTIETALIFVSRKHPDMTNYSAMAVYDAAIGFYKDIARGYQPKPVTLKGAEAEAYAAVHEACETRLGKPVSTIADAPILSPEDLVSCLRRVRKSVDFWTKGGGRRGYLDYVRQFV